MEINAAQLTHDGVAPATAGKIIDLGFNGDLSRKSDWNKIFVAFPKTAANTAGMTVKFYTKQDKLTTAPVLVNDSNLIATLTIPTEIVQKGGAYGFVVPKGVKRYYTVAFVGTNLPAVVTSGLTCEVDTDVVPGVDWTNYEATTEGGEVKDDMTKATEVIFA